MLSIRELFLKVKLYPQMPAEDWRKLFESSRFRQAVGQIVRMVRGERVGINMMDIAVCGAIAPYNLLLGGKLVCLLLCGPEVIKDYRARYDQQTSLIASCMRGASVKRACGPGSTVHDQPVRFRVEPVQPSESPNRLAGRQAWRKS